MIEWISQNLGTILISIGLIAAVVLSIRAIIKDKKQGKSCCGGSCAQCRACGHCPEQDKS